jgi:hypothetical protein
MAGGIVFETNVMYAGFYWCEILAIAADCSNAYPFSFLLTMNIPTLTITVPDPPTVFTKDDVNTNSS